VHLKASANQPPVTLTVFRSSLNIGAAHTGVLKLVQSFSDHAHGGERHSDHVHKDLAASSEDLAAAAVGDDCKHHVERALHVVVEPADESKEDECDSEVLEHDHTAVSDNNPDGTASSSQALSRERSPVSAMRHRVRQPASALNGAAESSDQRKSNRSKNSRKPKFLDAGSDEDDDPVSAAGNVQEERSVLHSQSASSPAAPGKAETAPSQVGSNTTASSVGYNTALQSVRKLALSEEAPMEPSIRCLQRFIRLTFIVVLVMAVVGFAVVQSSGSSLKKSVLNIVNAGELRSNIVQFRTALSTIVLSNEGLLPPMSASGEAADRNNMRRAVMRAFDLHKQLYLETSAVGNDLETLYSANALPLESLVAGSVTETMVNLWDGVNRVLSAGARIVETPLAQITSANPDVFLVQENTAYHDSIFEAVMQVIVLYQQQAERNTQLVIQTQAILMAAAIGVLTVIVLFVFPPVVRHVNRTANRVFDLFLDINQIQIIEIAKSREEVLVTLGVGSEAGGMCE